MMTNQMIDNSENQSELCGKNSLFYARDLLGC